MMFSFPSDSVSSWEQWTNCVGAGLALLAIIILAACGGGSPHIGDHVNDGDIPATALTTTDAQQVNITLSDFTITASRTSFIVGTTYRLVITNASKTPHALAIAPLLPAGHAMGDEGIHKAALVFVGADQLPTGQAKTVIYTFTNPAPAGRLELACHILGHDDAGMHTPITVAWHRTSVHNSVEAAIASEFREVIRAHCARQGPA